MVDLARIESELAAIVSATSTLEKVTDASQLLASLYRHQGVLVRLPRTRDVEVLLLRVSSQIAELMATAKKLRAASAAAAAAVTTAASPAPPAVAQPPTPVRTGQPPVEEDTRPAAGATVPTTLDFSHADGPPDIPYSEILFDPSRDLIGEGAFGVVYRATCQRKPVAVKIWKKTEWSEDQRAAIRAEVSLMKKIYSPNVVLFLGVATSPDGNVMIVSELMKTDLEHLIFDQRREPLSVERKLWMLRDAALGCNWLHGICAIVHHDLKLANLLVDENGRVAVADFGLSEFRKHGSLGHDEGEMSKGTPLYSAPEVLTRQPFDNSIDVYAFGLIVYEAVFERRVFTHHTQLEPFIDAVCRRGERPPIPEKIVQTTEARRKAMPDQAPPPGLVELIRRMWAHEPKARPTFSQVVDELETILLRVCMTDADARAFWAKHFAKPSLKTEVQWKEVAMLIADNALASPGMVQQLAPLLCVKYQEHGHATGSVSMKMFDIAAQWFGPFFLPDVGPGIIADMVELGRQPWFHFDLCKKEASDARLLRRPNGTFLIRVSFTDPKQSPFTLSLVRNGQPSNFRIVRLDQAGRPPGTHRFCVAIPGTTNCILFNSLQEFVETQMQPTSPMQLTDPCPRETVSAAGYGMY